ncbi:Apolipoprotein L3-like [Caenorhabditis elegans]|uniref:Apolipoprotein L3-like n=1 Tax=Caenorhabditis elegans TaxID=6239 RepID=Q8WQF7_CAEEL|nr:Apolipoprotein L3-like [Caenorhabditis elegans]CCD68751.1 Apolipoprotein L3-like [Caenorhabditis elegans]|eukprot:NP_740989.1 Uncharacterized protein CELE_F07F6.8 [Caenorhabditis elegans]
MQIKDDHDDAGSQSEDNGVPIYDSLESLLFIPRSMSKELSETALRTQFLLDKWSNNRRKIVRQMEGIAEKLDNWEKGCAISTAVGSTVGIASGIAVIGGLILMPPVAIAGLIVGTASGVSNLATGITKFFHTKGQHKEVAAMIAEDGVLFEELLKSREELMEAVRKIVEDEEFFKHFKNDGDIENKLKTVFGGSVTGITGIGTRFAITSMGRLSSSLVKGVLHSVAVIGIVLDSVTLALSAKTLGEGSVSELGSSILEASSKMEMMRQKVVKHFLNEDVWKDDDDVLSDVGSIEMVQPESPNQSLIMDPHQQESSVQH